MALNIMMDDGWVRVSLDADHKYFYITVADSGMGIPEDSIERIFERFYRVDKSHSKKSGEPVWDWRSPRVLLQCTMERSKYSVKKERELHSLCVFLCLIYRHRRCHCEKETFNHYNSVNTKHPCDGCSVEIHEDPGKQDAKYYLYDISSDETQLQKKSYSPEETTADYMLKDMMQRMNSQQTDSQNRVSLLPEGVQMNYSVEEDVLVVNFNSQYSSMSRARELLVRAGVVKTFLQVPGINSVRFTIENEDLTDSRGQAVGNMTADTFAEFTGTEPDAYCSNTFTLYFTDKSGQKLVKEQRTVRYKRSIPKERIVLEQLMKGPLEKGHYPTIPENTEVLNVTIADRICYVAFDGVFLPMQLDVSEKIPVYSVVNSLLDALDADKVQITVGGKDRLDTFGKKMELYHFYERNDKLVVKEKE